MPVSISDLCSSIYHFHSQGDAIVCNRHPFYYEVLVVVSGIFRYIQRTAIYSLTDVERTRSSFDQFDG